MHAMLLYNYCILCCQQGVTKRCRQSWLTNSALVYEPKFGGMGEGCGVSANEYSCANEAQINFGDLTPYLTYGCQVCRHLPALARQWWLRLSKPLQVNTIIYI
jgi:hypothetical protein